MKVKIVIIAIIRNLFITLPYDSCNTFKVSDHVMFPEMTIYNKNIMLHRSGAQRPYFSLVVPLKDIMTSASLQMSTIESKAGALT